ncbi:hypothetical protein DFH11DRAFT_890209 [Phellopilus nigrolimitatus]|nr:hypothetical protein DFH11DRAFT_890209 [Phellopilus nigrolimitatus]
MNGRTTADDDECGTLQTRNAAPTISSDGTHTLWMRRSASSHSTVKPSPAFVGGNDVECVRALGKCRQCSAYRTWPAPQYPTASVMTSIKIDPPISIPPTLDRLASAAHSKPGLLVDAGSVGLGTPRAYLPERVAGALGAVLTSRCATRPHHAYRLVQAAFAERTNVDNASTTTLSPATRAQSLQDDFSGTAESTAGVGKSGVRTPNDVAKALDPMSTA